MTPVSRYITVIALAGLFITSCKDERPAGEEPQSTDTAVAATTPVIPYSLVNEFPHDPAAFTEGLEFIGGYMYESVGRYGQSDIRKTDLKTGKILQQQKMDPRYFGEGLTVLNGKIYQLTYQERTGMVYDQKTFKLLQTFPLATAEGWGMTNDGKHLIYGDGITNHLYFIDPASFKEVKRVGVTDNFGPVGNINELEYIKGYIYANQWRTNYILKIDPSTGKVVGQANLNDLRAHTNIPEPVDGNETAPEVMNGIAYDSAANRIFITGKNWPKLFEIKLDN